MTGKSCLQEEKGPGWKVIQQGQQRNVLLIADQFSLRGRKADKRVCQASRSQAEAQERV